MKPEPLKDKIVYYETELEGKFEPDYVLYKHIKSAVAGLIQFHEDRIEELVISLQKHDRKGFGNFQYFTELIEREYESIMAIEYWLEDVI